MVFVVDARDGVVHAEFVCVGCMICASAWVEVVMILRGRCRAAERSSIAID